LTQELSESKQQQTRLRADLAQARDQNRTLRAQVQKKSREVEQSSRHSKAAPEASTYRMDEVALEQELKVRDYEINELREELRASKTEAMLAEKHSQRSAEDAQRAAMQAQKVALNQLREAEIYSQRREKAAKSEMGEPSSVANEELENEQIAATQLASELRELQAEWAAGEAQLHDRYESEAASLNLARAEVSRAYEAEQQAQERYVQARDERNRLSADLRREPKKPRSLRQPELENGGSTAEEMQRRELPDDSPR